MSKRHKARWRDRLLVQLQNALSRQERPFTPAQLPAIADLPPDAREWLIEEACGPRGLNVAGSELVFHVHSVTEDSRVRKFKEPWTTEWMRALPDDAVLYDIGANIGITALLAAEGAARKVRVVAIEPFPANFVSLVKNVVANKLEARVFPLAVGLGRTTGATPLHWANAQAGSSLHSFGSFVQLKDRPATAPVRSHHCMCYRLDDLVRFPGLPRPTHIKVDVDGGELDVLEGARETLQDPSCRALQIEVVDADQSCRRSKDVIEIAEGAGFTVAATYVHAEGYPRVSDIQFTRT